MGAAELGDVIKDYRGSYIMAFAAYNAGRGRVKEWVGRFGDPRDPKVDPIDWVERIPFSETRNYVQRVMENVQVYRVRFGGSSRLLIEADLRRGASGELSAPRAARRAAVPATSGRGRRDASMPRLRYGGMTLWPRRAGTARC